MNKTNPEAIEFVRGLVERVGETEKAVVLICPPFTAISELSGYLSGSKIQLGGQNMYFEESGAYTGEISPTMLLTSGCRFVILGHSERRQIFSESDKDVNKKVKLALHSGLLPIICVGELLEQREQGLTEEVIGAQIDGSCDGLTEDNYRKIVVAYEPVWAIGTGKTATPEMAQDVHRFIREKLKSKCGAFAERISILYGGSVKSDNAAGLMSQPDIDGALIGGASLKLDEFVKIINSV